jgi:hypothetical protein
MVNPRESPGGGHDKNWWLTYPSEKYVSNGSVVPKKNGQIWKIKAYKSNIPNHQPENLILSPSC